MRTHRALTALGAGITAFLGVAVALIELLPFEFSAIVGLPIGLVAAVGVVVGFLSKYDAVSPRTRLVATALAGFGYGVVAAFAANYVNLLDTPFEITLAVGVLAGVFAVVLVLHSDRHT